MKTCATVVFVKTPGFSPLKTRLAKSIGKESAELFFVKSVKAIEEVLLKTKDLLAKTTITPIWSVAEEEALSEKLWNNFTTIAQPQGSLGERLHSTYQKLYQNYDSVIFLGADSPQISPQLISQTIDINQRQNKFVIGPATDGGYYLFCGNGNLPKLTWTDINYSVDTTCAEFINQLKNTSPIEKIMPLNDVDTIEDLKSLCDYLRKTDNKNLLLEKQQDLIDLIQNILKQVS